MKNKYGFVAVMLLSIFLVSAGLTSWYVRTETKEEENGQVTVVTSFYPMYIAAMNVVGDTPGVSLQNLSEPQTGCLHDFTLTPQDMKLLSTADVFVINGGGIEVFLGEVAKSYPKLHVIDASEHLSLLEGEAHVHVHGNEEELHEEDVHEEVLHEEEIHEEELHEEELHEEDAHNHEDAVNAHAWMSIPLYREQVSEIAEQLSAVDAAHAQQYRANAKAYDEQLAVLEKKMDALKEELRGTNVILFHEAYAYLAEDLGMHVCGNMNLDEERQVSAGEVAEILEEIEAHQVSFVLAEELYGSNMGELVTKEGQVQMLYLDTLNRGEYQADSYIRGMESNISLLSEMIK